MNVIALFYFTFGLIVVTVANDMYKQHGYNPNGVNSFIYQPSSNSGGYYPEGEGYDNQQSSLIAPSYDRDERDLNAYRSPLREYLNENFVHQQQQQSEPSYFHHQQQQNPQENQGYPSGGLYEMYGSDFQELANNHQGQSSYLDSTNNGYESSATSQQVSNYLSNYETPYAANGNDYLTNNQNSPAVGYPAVNGFTANLQENEFRPIGQKNSNKLQIQQNQQNQQQQQQLNTEAYSIPLGTKSEGRNTNIGGSSISPNSVDLNNPVKTSVSSTESAAVAIHPPARTTTAILGASHFHNTPRFINAHPGYIGNAYQHQHIHPQIVHSKVHLFPISKHVHITKHVPIPILKQVHVPVNKPVKVEIPHPVIVPVPQPYPIRVPVTHPIAVSMVKEISIPVEKVVPYPVEKKIPFTVEKHVPYNVEKHITVPVPQPYPVRVPIFKTIFHKVQAHNLGYAHGWH